MRRFVYVSLILAAVSNSYGFEPRLFGYFEPQLMGGELDGEFKTLYSNKLRIDIEAVPSTGIKFGANVNYFNYSGETTYSILDYLPYDLTTEVYPGTEDNYRFAFADSIALDNVYLRMSFKSADLTVGKQQISYGTGYAWNPTDLFNLKDVLDPTYEQTGHNAVRLDVQIKPGFNVTGLYAPGEEWDRPTALFRLKTRMRRFDLSFSGMTTQWLSTSYPSLTAIEEWRRLVGCDLVGQLLGLGVWAEAAYNEMESSDNFWEGAAGFDYTFRSELYVLGEVYYNSGVPESSEDYTLADWMRYFTGENKTLGRSQAYLFLQYPVTDLVSLGSSIIGCINDESVALVPQLYYSLFQDVELTAYGNFYVGDEGTMYSKDLGNGGLIRLRVYF